MSLHLQATVLTHDTSSVFGAEDLFRLESGTTRWKKSATSRKYDRSLVCVGCVEVERKKQGGGVERERRHTQQRKGNESRGLSPKRKQSASQPKNNQNNEQSSNNNRLTVASPAGVAEAGLPWLVLFALFLLFLFFCQNLVSRGCCWIMQVSQEESAIKT